MRTPRGMMAVVILFLAAGTMRAPAQERVERKWIFLTERSSVILSHQAEAADLSGLSERALKRRAKVLPPERLVEENDLPIPEQILNAIRASGANIVTTSRWLNAVSVEATSLQLQSIRSLPNVLAIESVASYTRRKPTESNIPEMRSLDRSVSVNTFDYGPSFTQLNGMKAIDLHNLGVTGKGVIVGMLDDGFTNHRTHEATASIQVLAEYDFIQRDSNTSVAPGEHASQGNHGGGTLSVLGGNMPGKLIGAAPGAEFILGKTEIDSVEVHIEEDKYVEGLEWLERLGADIVSTSLGYRNGFTPPDVDYPISAMDGRTTIVARGSIVAARKGVLLVTAMGNEGGSRQRDSVTGSLIYDERTMVSPADADSVLGVGATASDGELAVFSGTGPTADGRIKPDVVTQGMGVYWISASTTTGYSTSNGTSLATPLVAGAAALVLSAHPGLTAMQLRDALRMTTTTYNDGTYQTSTWPNNTYGCGRVNALAAALYFGPVASNEPTISLVGDSLDVRIFIRSNASLIPDSLRMFYRKITDTVFTSTRLRSTATPYQYSTRILYLSGQSQTVGYFTYADNAGHSQRLPFTAPVDLISISVPIVPPPIPIPQNFVLQQNYPNPFNSGTVIRVDIPAEARVDVDVFDLLGRHVRSLYAGVAMPPQLRLTWDGRDASHRSVSSGMYLCRMKTPTSALVRKMLYVK